MKKGKRGEKRRSKNGLSKRPDEKRWQAIGDLCQIPTITSTFYMRFDQPSKFTKEVERGKKKGRKKEAIHKPLGGEEEDGQVPISFPNRRHAVRLSPSGYFGSGKPFCAHRKGKKGGGHPA